MQNIKIMFRSPRFLVGIILVMTVVLYAIFYPMINTADPKADRAPNPVHTLVEPLREALATEDSAVVHAELDRLTSQRHGGLTDAQQDSFEMTIQEVRNAIDAGGLSKALSGAKQVKKTNPLYGEFDTLRRALGAEEGIPADEASARAELEILAAHHEEIVALAEAVRSGDAETCPALTLEEAQALRSALEAGDTETLEKEAAKLLSAHEMTFEWIHTIGERLDAGGYEDAATVLSGVQKTILIPKDQPPMPGFPFGTDNFSRNIFLEMAYGARLSLSVGLIAGAVATTIGLTLGLFAGFTGGIVDNVITTITNIFIVIPSMIVLILISIALGQIKQGWLTGLVIGLTAWPWTARAVRAQTTSLRNRDHVSMARITGYNTARIILTEILPYIASYVVMAFILQVASGIMQEATLAILGLGDPTAISLGRMINWAMQYEAVRSGRWWQFIPVASAIAMITFGLYMINSGMDQVFNPKIRS